MLVKREGHGDFVKVLDFGLAQVPRRITEEAPQEGAPAASSKLTKLGDIFGTPPYMAPEQLLGDKTDTRTDLYALGIILYEMLAGVRPFPGKSLLVLMQEHLTMPPPLISERAPTVKVPKEVDALVQRLLAKSPDERIQRPEEVLEEIDRITAAYQLAWPLKSLSTNRSEDSRMQGGRRERPTGRDRRLTQQMGPAALRTWLATRLALSKLGGTLSVVRRSLYGPMQRAPRWLRISGGLLIIALPLGLALRALLSKPSISSNPPTAAVRRTKALDILAPQGAFDTAVARGPEALETLASRYPSDARILRALLKSYTSQRRHVEAMRLIAKLAALDPGAKEDSEVIHSIVAAVQGDAESVEAAATLLEQDLGEAGVDLLYDLTVKQTGAGWKPRLNQSLAKPELLAKASPPTRLALELRMAKRCESKRDLLPRAQQEGDRRALAQLKSLAQTQGCGFLGLRDCWPCLRKSRVLQDAITTLEARTKDQGPP